MLTCHILLDVVGQVVAGRTDGVVGHDATQRDNSNLSRTTTDVDNHVALGSLNVNTDTDGSGHRFENQVDVTSVSMFGRVAHRT